MILMWQQHMPLQKYDLDDIFKFNIEANHATLCRSYVPKHELRMHSDNDMLGSVDANQGHPLLDGIPMNSPMF